jgi:hypothetical protein
MGTFVSEKEMKEVAVNTLPECVRSNSNTQVITEFEYSTGRADVVLLDISQAYWERRVDNLNLTQPIDEKVNLQTFLQLHGRGPVTPDYFLEIGALDRREKSSALNWLESNGFIDRLDDGRIRTAKKFRRHVTTSISVELKLSKWKDALNQAKRGSSFTQYQYVAIDEDHVKKAKNQISHFIDSNVGLLSIDSDGECTFHYRPERNTPVSKLHQWRLNERSLEMMG